ncbi:Dot/Icm T4SS effector VpdC [Legionella sp. CNM-4043-24]|uniref:Dot/Icm T4SS effector VpdC n=1 Tax=Legionella sp. CNM-4043-24 TaxID=3421646 RepID=UPI00403ADF24
MPGNDVLIELLQQDGLSHPNSDLLKKYLLCIHHGRFLVNGSSPSQNFSLGDYLLDNERVVLDFTHLSDMGKETFFDWFLNAHRADARRAFLSGVKTTDYRGYTAEVALSWWGRITNFLFYKKRSWQWSLSPLNLLPNAQLGIDYQLNGIELCEGRRGLLVGLNQLGVVEQPGKYQDPACAQDGSLRNTKRLFLKDSLVTKLTGITLENVNYEKIVNQPHPFAIPISNPRDYYQSMQEYRHTQRLVIPAAWYKRLWRWLVSWFLPPRQRAEAEAVPPDDYTLLDSDEKVRIYQGQSRGDILVMEECPELDSLVLSGGGAKIFGHVGAYSEFEKAGIQPVRFAGSSAGAIMSLLCYLGYETREIVRFFQRFREDNLVFYNIDRSGLSDTRAVKAALDYMIVRKVSEIIVRHNLLNTDEGLSFVESQLYHKGKITFESLKRLKQFCRDSDLECEIKDHLIVTATNVSTQRTRYFSSDLTPEVEVSYAVTLSASFPVLFKPTIFQGELHNDGGIMNNLPTNAFPDDHSTFLESEYGNCLSLVAFQFDNGPEGGILRTLLKGRVYRENFLLNMIYGWLTGVRDPVSAWEQDRLKLLQHGAQTVLIPIGNVSATQFNVDTNTQSFLADQGRRAAKRYINARYCRSKETGNAFQDEIMHARFLCLEDALHYACYRRNEKWFRRLAAIAMDQGGASEKIDLLWEEHFAHRSIGVAADEDNDDDDDIEQVRGRDVAQRNTLFSCPLSVYYGEADMAIRMRLFEALYPVFLHVPYGFFSNSRDIKWFKSARHSLSLKDPFICLNSLNEIKGEVHVLFAMLVNLIRILQKKDTDSDACCDRLKTMADLLSQGCTIGDRRFYGHWALLDWQYDKILNELTNNNISLAARLCDRYRLNKEPPEYWIPVVEQPEIITSDDDDASESYSPRMSSR